MSGIDILPNAEQVELADAMARTLEDLFPVARLDHGRIAASIDEAVWATIAELGWIGMALPEEAGGVGYDLTDAVLVHRLLGRHFVTPSVTATVVAAKLALDAGDAAFVARLCSGAARAAFAMPCSAGEPEGDHYGLDLEGADVLVSLTEAGARFLELDLASAQPVEALDPTAPMVRAPHAVTGRPNPAAGLWAQALIASEMTGIALAATDKAVAYAKIREQFGKPIGSFQAIAHMCADCAMRGEAAVAQSNFAAIAIRDGHVDAAFQVGAAYLVSADAAFRNATSGIQVHGGMGFAAESDAHLYLKRAVLLRALARTGSGTQGARRWRDGARDAA
jgi:alkylation response protein AidB-like acyl-CoA dehydrogenase